MSMSAVSRVFGIPELLEAILLQIDTSNGKKQPEDRRSRELRLYNQRHGIPLPPQPPVLQLFTLQRVSHQFRATIIGSRALQRNLTLSSYIRLYNANRLPMMLKYLKVGRGKISNALASGKPGSWKTMRINHPHDKRTARFCSSDLEEEQELQTDSNTTLGMVVEWEHKVKAKTELLPVRVEDKHDAQHP